MTPASALRRLRLAWSLLPDRGLVTAPVAFRHVMAPGWVYYAYYDAVGVDRKREGTPEMKHAQDTAGHAAPPQEPSPAARPPAAQDAGAVPVPAKAEEYDYSADSGAGLANVGVDDLLIPRMLVAQSNTPEVAEGKVDGLRSGSLFIRQLNNIHFPGDPGPVVVPCGHTHVYNIFHPRDGEGPKGFVTTVADGDPTARRLKKETPFGKINLTVKDIEDGGWDAHDAIPGDQFVETYNMFALLLDGDQVWRVVFPCSSTHITPVKAFMTRATSMRGRRPADGKIYTYPVFAFRYRIKTFFWKEGTKSWFKIDFPFADGDMLSSRVPISSEVYEEAREFSKSIREGEVKVDMRDADRDEVRDDDAADRGPGSDHDRNLGDGEVPF